MIPSPRLAQWGMRRLVLALALVALAACENHHETRVGAAVLPQANDTTAAPRDVPTVVIMPGAMPTLPAGPVALAIDVDVPWSQIADVVRATPAPVLLVGRYDKTRAFRLEDELAPGPALRVRASADGKFCVSPPGTTERYCLQSSDKRHISAAFVREVLNKAVAEYAIEQATLAVEPGVLWADLVRTIDGTRTCCARPLKVSLR